jgi:hypothetical protein
MAPPCDSLDRKRGLLPPPGSPHAPVVAAVRQCCGLLLLLSLSLLPLLCAQASGVGVCRFWLVVGCCGASNARLNVAQDAASRERNVVC